MCDSYVFHVFHFTIYILNGNIACKLYSICDQYPQTHSIHENLLARKFVTNTERDVIIPMGKYRNYCQYC